MTMRCIMTMKSIVLQNVCCYKNGEKKTTMEERQTIIKLKNVGLSYREIAQKVKVSVITASFTIKMHYKTGANSDRIISEPKPQLNQRPSSES